MDRRVIFAISACILAGCHHRGEVPYENFLQAAVEPESSGSATAYQGYCEAGRIAETQAGSLGTRLNLTPVLKERLSGRIASARGVLRQAVKRSSLGFRFVPTNPSDPSIQCRGWAILGRDLVYQIDALAKSGNVEAALDNTLVATKFGYDLMAGSALEASLGLTIVDDARRAFVPYLNKLGAAQQGKLYEGLKAVLETRPRLSGTIEHERLCLRVGIQEIQDAYKNRETADLKNTYGSVSAKAISYLKGLDDQERITYFREFAQEIDAFAAFWSKESTLPTSDRHLKNGNPILNLAPSRPWQRFSAQLVGGYGPLVEQFDATFARTKLFALEAGINRAIKSQGFAPKDLAAFDTLGEDPYSGHLFAYRRDGREFKVYSVGRDDQDDGGQTNDGYDAPDLTLEHGI